ncbi:U3 snoRNP protein [Dipsacomyces acuminosporus]|nr:U3 snoRNP protein [Dipsacomyces acuminosporus]
MGGKEQSQAADAFAGAIPDLFIEQYVNRPGAFVVPNASVKAAAMEVVQGTYDAANYGDKFGLYDNWLSIVESGFDVSKQLWELINIRNEPVLKYTADTMKELSLLLDSVAEPSDEESSEEENESEEEPVSASEVEEKGELSQQDEDDEDDDDDDDDLAVHNSDDSGSDVASPAEDSDLDEDDASGVGARRSVVDDDFFSLAEMEGFADEAEEEDMRDRAILAGDHPKRAEADEESSESEDDEEDVDLFQGPVALGGDSDEEDGGDTESGFRADQMMYADFFEPPKGSKRALAKASRERHAKRPKFDPTAEQPESEFGSEDGESEDESEFGSEDGESEDGESGDETTGRKKNLFDDDSDDEGDGETAADGEGKSEFEKRQEKLQQLIGKLEDEAVEKKHWTMVGEVDSKARPKNSLLEQDLDFDQVQKPVPVITQDVTQTLEDIIKRRILNEEWDDVERKKDIQAKPFKPSQFFELDDKAPKKSLAEEYEEEFMAQKAGDAYVPEKDAKAEEAHKEIDMLFRSLFTQLDALSNFHFAPKPATADIEIRTSAPALHMEEKLPVNVSHAEQLAPEEVYEKNKGYDGRTGDLMGDSEMTREDRKRRRQKKKQQYKKVTSAIEAAKGGRLPAPPKPASQAKTAAKK